MTHTLKANRKMDQGWYLIDEEENEVLLPNAYVPENFKEDDELDAFVYLDSEERYVATTIKPFVELYEFAYLKVMQVNKVGAFVDWGLVKQLFIPFSEQKVPMKEGRSYLIYLDFDEKSERLYGSNTENKHIIFDDIDLKLGEEVKVLIYEKNEFGLQAIVNNEYKGLIFESDIHKELRLGDRTKAYVKNIRDDGKIDLVLSPIGFRNAIDVNSQVILDALDANDGILYLNDKSDPELIKQKLGLSKKAFKRALGGLYKQKMVSIGSEGIKLLKK